MLPENHFMSPQPRIPIKFETTVTAPPVQTGRLTVLIIDDEDAMREVLRMTLEDAGHTVLSAASGEQGRQIALHLQPDVILCDVHMPEMSGHALQEALKADYETRHIPFIFLTGCLEKQSIRRGMAAGAVDYLVKPFRPDELEEAIAVCGRKLAFFDRLPDPVVAARVRCA
jgi:CheY-like chemotaxis protein